MRKNSPVALVRTGLRGWVSIIKSHSHRLGWVTDIENLNAILIPAQKKKIADDNRIMRNVRLEAHACRRQSNDRSGIALDGCRIRDVVQAHIAPWSFAADHEQVAVR